MTRVCVCMRSYGTEQHVSQVNLDNKRLDYITPQNWKRRKYTFHYKKQSLCYGSLKLLLRHLN